MGPPTMTTPRTAKDAVADARPGLLRVLEALDYRLTVYDPNTPTYHRTLDQMVTTNRPAPRKRKPKP